MAGIESHFLFVDKQGKPVVQQGQQEGLTKPNYRAVLWTVNVAKEFSIWQQVSWKRIIAHTYEIIGFFD